MVGGGAMLRDIYRELNGWGVSIPGAAVGSLGIGGTALGLGTWLVAAVAPVSLVWRVVSVMCRICVHVCVCDCVL